MKIPVVINIFLVILLCATRGYGEFKSFSKDSLQVSAQNSAATPLYISPLEVKDADLPAINALMMDNREMVALGAMVVGAWGGYWTRREADKYYEKYLLAGDSRKMDNYWDKTARWDLASDVLIITSYVATGYLLQKIVFKK